MKLIKIQIFLAFFFLVTPVYAAVATDGLEGYWKFDETSGLAASDSSGHSNGGTLTGAPSISTTVPTTTFSNVRSLDFDGTGDYVTMGDQPNLEVEGSLPFSISLWFRPNASPGAESTYALVTKGTASGQGYAFQYEQIGGNFVINLSKYGVVDQRVTITELNTSTWYHLVAVQRSSAVEYFIDGISQGTYSNASAFNASGSDPFRVGADAAGNLGTNGLIDEVRVYSRELATAEISDLAAGRHTVATWDGSSSTNPEIAANWDINAVPDPYTRLTIADVTNQPVATTNIAMAGLTIASGAWFDLVGHNLTMNDAGTFSNDGTLRLNNSQTISGFTNDTDSGTVMLYPSGNTTGLQTGNSYFDLILNDSLVGYWQLDETTSGSTDSVIDRSGYDGHGTPSGSSGGNNKPQPATAVPEVNFIDSRSLDFDGDDDVITVLDADRFDLGSTFTLAAWTYVDTHDAGYSFLISRDSVGDSSYDLGFKGGRPYAAINDGVWGEYVADDVLATGEWHHIAATRRSDNTLQIYVDGAEVKEFTSVKTPRNAGVNVTIGKRTSSSYEHDGRIDDVRIYNDDLSDAAIARLGAGETPQHSATTVTLTANLTVAGDLILNSGTLDTSAGNNYGVSVAGNFENNGGVFTPQLGAVTLNGSSQSITSSNTFYDLIKAVTATDTLTFAQRSITTITNSTSLQGQSGNLLTLSSAVGGTQFSIDPQGSRNFSYLSVADSNNANATAIGYSSSNIYGSNLTNWTTTGPVESQESANSGSSTTSTRNIASSSCSDTAPDGSPDLFQIDASIDSATIYFTPLLSTDQYYISFSSQATAEEHGAQVQLGSDGVQRYAVNLLSPNTTYYFKVRGQYGCKPGEWSAIRAVQTKGNQVQALVAQDVERGKPITDAAEIVLQTESTKKEKEYELTVTVRNQKEPVVGAEVALASGEILGTTNELGEVTFRKVRQGKYSLKVVQQAYAAEQEIEVRGDSDKFDILVNLDMGEPTRQKYLYATAILAVLNLFLVGFLFLRKKK